MPGFNIPFNNACHDEYAVDTSPGYRGPAHLVETARSHRYLLQVLRPLGGENFNLDDDLLLFLAKCTRPEMETDEIVIHNGKDEIYRPGKNRWRPIEFTFYEKLDEEAQRDVSAGSIFRWWARECNDIRNSRILPPSELATDSQLDLLNGAGESIYTYQLYRCWPSKVSPSGLDYSSSDICKITVTMRFDKAIESWGGDTQ